MILRDIFYSFNPRGRLLLRRIWYFPTDLFATLFHKRDKLVPPRSLIYTGAGDFAEVGNRFAEKIIRDCSLSDKSRLLDIGCGIGRIARPFTKFLSTEGFYQGFDIVPQGVAWCRRHYHDYPNFHFDYIPLKNDLYNLSASRSASAFTFPYKTGSFDVACAISVFTHMQQTEVTQYFREISRILVNGGHCFCTFFLITEERLQENNDRIEQFFRYNHGDYYLHDNRVKNANIAYRMEIVEKIAAEAGLKMSDFLLGWWADEEVQNKFDFQDVVVLQKRV